jgi:hypothetical protein
MLVYTSTSRYENQRASRLSGAPAALRLALRLAGPAWHVTGTPSGPPARVTVTHRQAAIDDHCSWLRVLAVPAHAHARIADPT